MFISNTVCFADVFLVELGEPPMVLVAVSSGRNHVSGVTLKLSASGVTFRLKDAYLHEGRQDMYAELLVQTIYLGCRFKISDHANYEGWCQSVQHSQRYDNLGNGPSFRYIRVSSYGEPLSTLLQESAYLL